MTSFKSYDKKIPRIINEYKLSKAIEEFINFETLDAKYRSEAKRYYSSIIYKVQFCCISELDNINLVHYKKSIKIIENITLEQLKNNKQIQTFINAKPELYIPTLF